MAKKKVHHEEHADESWLIPYGDMLTLLLALFIVMFAMGQIDKKKMEQFGNQFNIIFAGGTGVLDKNGNAVIPSPNPTPNQNPNPTNANANNNPDIDPLNNGKTQKEIEDDKMKEIMGLLQAEIAKGNFSDKIKLVLNRTSLEISIQDTVLFASGDASILKNVDPILELIAKMFSQINNEIRIVGHTDNVPIKNERFRSNWDLSAIRAINVMEFLIQKGHLKPDRFTIQGNGEYSPKYDNSTAAGRAQNRRVEIFVIRRYPLSEEPAGQEISLASPEID